MGTIVWLVLDINLKVMDDTSVLGTYSSLDKAMMASFEDVVSKKGKDIKCHNFQIEGEEYSTNRVSNNLCLGSNYGITYNSFHGNYPCCRMVICQTVK